MKSRPRDSKVDVTRFARKVTSVLESKPKKTCAPNSDRSDFYSVNCVKPANNQQSTVKNPVSSPCSSNLPLVRTPPKWGREDARGLRGEPRNVVTSKGQEPACGSGPALTVEPSAALGSYRVSHTGPLIPRIAESCLIREFQRYIQTTAKTTFRIYSTTYENGLAFSDDRELGYIHRWTPVYRASIIAKFYLLEAYAKSHPTRYTMATFTTAQDGVYSVEMRGGITTIEESFELLKEGWQGISKWIRKHHPGLDYIWMMEPHKTGYPHMHVVFLGNIPEESQRQVKTLWSSKYLIGSYDNGVKFTTPPINSIRNYLTKYIQKTLHGGKTGSKYEASTEGWTRGELLFNAVMWKHGWRLWGASATLSKVMAKPDSEIRETHWEFTDLIDEYGTPHVTGWADGYEISPTRRKTDLPT